MDGYTNCLDTIGDSGIADSCDVSFFAYENCVGDAVDAAPSHESDIAWCGGFYSAWELCVTREGCTSSCADASLEPSDCTEYASNFCSLASCCPACELLVTESYAKCAADGGGCINPTCSAASSYVTSLKTNAIVAAVVGVVAIIGLS